MPISTSAVWELRSTATASMVNGGGFVTGATGTDYSQQDAAQYNLTTASSAGAGDTLLSASAAANMVGNIAQAISGTNITPGWYEILSVSVGVSITFSTNKAGTSIATGAALNGVVNIGGALDNLSDAFLEQVSGANKIWIKKGTYTPAAAISIASTSGTYILPISITGYNAARNDEPAYSNCPTMAMGANGFTSGRYQHYRNIQFTTSHVTGITLGIYNRVENCKILGLGDAGIVLGETNCITGCDISSASWAVTTANTSVIIGNYIHDTLIGIFSTNSPGIYANNIIARCATKGIDCGINSASSNLQTFNNTIYGSAAKIGIGISFISNSANQQIFNNTISGCATGIQQTTAATGSIRCFNNNFYNNTTDVTNQVKLYTNTALDPQFIGVSETTGTGATSATTVLTDASGVFTNVVDNRDILYVISATTTPVGYYPIISHNATTLTVAKALGTGSNISYFVGVGHNFGIGSNLKNIGLPLNFGEGLTTNYSDLGAVQAVGGSPAVPPLGVAY